MFASDTNFRGKIERKATKIFEKPTLLCKGPLQGMKSGIYYFD